MGHKKDLAEAKDSVPRLVSRIRCQLISWGFIDDQLELGVELAKKALDKMLEDPQGQKILYPKAINFGRSRHLRLLRPKVLYFGVSKAWTTQK